MSDADKGPRELWINLDTNCPGHEIFEQDVPDYHWGKLTRLIEHSAYLAVKQELEEARAKYEEIISYLPKVPTEPYERDLRKQLAEANKKIEELNHLYKQAVDANK